MGGGSKNKYQCYIRMEKIRRIYNAKELKGPVHLNKREAEVIRLNKPPVLTLILSDQLGTFRQGLGYN